MSREQVLHLVAADVGLRERLAKVLAADEIPIRSYADAQGFLDACPAGSLDHACVLIDADLPGASGLSLLKTLRERRERVPRILLTEKHDRALRRSAIEAGATDVLDRSLIDAFLLQRLAQLSIRVSGAAASPADRMELADGTLVTYRMIRPEDAEIEQDFVRGLSASSRYRRFFSSIRELPAAVLQDFTHPHFPRSYALIATIEEPSGSDGTRERQIGVARYAPTERPEVAEFAVAVADEWQRRGIASQLLRVLTTAAAVAGIQTLEGEVLRENEGMLDLCRKLGFRNTGTSDDLTVVCVAKELGGEAVAGSSDPGR